MPGRPTPPRATSTASGTPSETAPFTASPSRTRDAVVDEREDHDQPGDRAEAEAERRRAVVVERRERARRDARVDLGGGGRDEPRQQLRRALASSAARSARRRPRGARRPRPRRAGRARRPARAPTSRTRGRAARRRAARANSRQHDDPQRARDQHEREVDGVGGEEAVGLLRRGRTCARGSPRRARPKR